MTANPLHYSLLLYKLYNLTNFITYIIVPIPANECIAIDWIKKTIPTAERAKRRPMITFASSFILSVMLHPLIHAMIVWTPIYISIVIDIPIVSLSNVFVILTRSGGFFVSETKVIIVQSPPRSVQVSLVAPSIPGTA